MLRDPEPAFVPKAELSRRALLRSGAVLAGGFLIGIELPPAPARADEPLPTGTRFNAFIHIALSLIHI